VIARNAVDGLADLAGIDVERGSDFQFETLAVEIFGDGLSEVSHAQHGDIHLRRAVEDSADVFDEHLHVVPFLRIARKADQHQVAPDLHGRDAVDGRPPGGAKKRP